jgi:hypothetical protein
MNFELMGLIAAAAVVVAIVCSELRRTISVAP